MSNVADRFWQKVEKDGSHLPGMTTQCWEWTGAYDNQDYPRFKMQGSAMYANRARHLIEGVPLKTEQHIVAFCQNKRCVRPEHHAVGTEKDSRSFGVGGRIYPGDQCLMRQVIAEGETVEYVAEAYDISVEWVEQIIATE